MQVHLRDHIAQSREIDLAKAQLTLDEFRHPGAIGGNRRQLLRGKVEDILLLGVGHENEPGYGRVAVEQQRSRGETPQCVTVFCELRMDHGLDS